MKQNIVILSLSEYNKLYNFKEKVESGNSVILMKSYDEFLEYPATLFINDESVHAELLAEIKELEQVNKEFEKTSQRLSNEIHDMLLRINIEKAACLMGAGKYTLTLSKKQYVILMSAFIFIISSAAIPIIFYLPGFEVGLIEYILSFIIILSVGSVSLILEGFKQNKL